MYSTQFSSGEGQQDQSANYQQTQQSECHSSITDLGMQYEHMINNTLHFISLKQISPQVLKHHRITITHNTNLSQIFNVYEKDCYITIKKRHHYGTHCIYDVVLANFTLEIYLLNLHRSSDDNDAALSQEQIGKGGFGSVRVVKAGNNTLAVKRINFLKKAHGINGFDFQTQNAQCKQIHKAIRQYCLYKICSMLKIGPQVIFNSNYDLVCFNNCIEFIMQLCQIPSKNKNFMKERGLTIQKMKQDLFQNLALLHRLNIVHRDIKPDNILYSESLQRFVFTDFGITHSVSEQKHEKSLTNFAGTFDYCCQYMRDLFDQGKGYVNLYINDYYGLKKSIYEWQNQTQKSSQLSFNEMSFNNESISNMSYAQHLSENSIKSGSFQQWFQNYSSESCPPNSSSNIYLSSTRYINAPIKYASEINFFQSLILYKIFSTYEQKIKDLTPIFINVAIEQYLDEMSCHFVQEQIKRYVLAIFYPSGQCSNLTLKIVDLKNTARNYGPKNQQTLQKIDQILSQLFKSDHEQVYEYFKSLKQSIQTNPQSFDITKFSKQMMIHLYLKNYNYFIGCCIRIMRENVRLLNRLKHLDKNESIFKVNRAFVCKIFIFCQKSNVLTIHQNNIINQLFLKHWDKNQIIQLQTQIDEIQNELISNHVYNTKDYKYTQDPSNNRIVAKLTKYAIEYLMKSDQITNFQILQAFNVFNYRFNWKNAPDYNFYNQFINKFESIQNEDLEQNKKISLQVEIVKVYRKICQFQNHQQQIDKTYYLKKVKVITYNLKRLPDKKYYFTCATQLIWICYESPELNHMVSQMALKTLNQLKQYECPQIQKYHCLIHIHNIIGSIFLKESSFVQALDHFRMSENLIVSVYGSENLMLSYFQILQNIALVQYRQKDLQNALASYQGVLHYVQRTKKILCYEKSIIYRSIITIRLQIGVKQQDFSQIEILIKKIVYETIFTLVSITTSQYQLKHYILDLSIFKFVDTPNDLSVKIFVMKTLLKYIEDHLNYLRIPYDKLNYQLNKIYTNDIKQPSKGLVYIWNYIKTKLQDFKNVTIDDYRLLNNFTSRLIKSNSSRRALIILKKYIYHIPLDMFKERQKAFRLFHNVHLILGHPFERITYELINKDCEMLYNRDFGKIYKEQTNHEAKMVNILLNKWLQRI